MNDLEKLASPRWRLNHLYKIINKNSEVVTFNENPIQKKINDCDAIRKIILKARQFGVSTNCILQMFDHTIWNRNQTTCILAHEQDSIKKLFRICKRAYDLLDESIKPVIDRGGGSKYEMFFPAINSRIYCDLESRGDTINYLHISELAFFKDPNRLWATLQTVPLNGRVTIETTPNGIGNFFYKMWVEHTEYEKLFFPWFEFPEYKLDANNLKPTKEEKQLIKKYNLSLDQIAFRRFKQNELKHIFIQEYPEDDQTCFISSGNNVINADSVKLHLQRAKQSVDQDGINIYVPNNKEHKYVIGCDTAEGVGGDFSVASVIDVNTLEQVACLRCQLKPSDFAHKIDQLANLYHVGKQQYPLVAVERNNHGHAVLLELNEHINYQNLYKTKDGKVGWLTDRITRPIMLHSFIDGVENATISLNDKNTLNECFTLINNSGKIEAVTGEHDDCIFATSIALQACIETSNLSLYDNISSKILL